MAVQDVGGLKETLTRIEMERERLAELSESFSRVIRYFESAGEAAPPAPAPPADGEVQSQPSPAVSARSEVRRILEARGQQPPFAV